MKAKKVDFATLKVNQQSLWTYRSKQRFAQPWSAGPK